MTLLDVRSLSVFYGDFQALHDISLTVEEGATVSIIGANGAGKSTLLNAITGLNTEKHGTITFSGQEITRVRADLIARRGVTMVPEGRRLFPTLSVEDNLLMGHSTGRTGVWNLDTVYALFPILREFRKREASRLSGGQQQMVSIARALMTNPKILLCDEISLGLAPKVILDIYQCFGTIKQSGVSVVLIEQNVAQACAAADYVYCLLEGKISLQGKPDELTMNQISQAYFGSHV